MVRPCRVEVGEQVEHLDLVGEVEEGRGLVEQQDVGALGQGHGDPHPLALAARQLVDRAVGQVGGARAASASVDRGLVLARTTAGTSAGAGGGPGRRGRPRRCRRATWATGAACPAAGPRPGSAGGGSPRRRAAPCPPGLSSRARARSSVDLPHALAPDDDRDPAGGDGQRQVLDDDAVVVGEPRCSADRGAAVGATASAAGGHGRRCDGRCTSSSRSDPVGPGQQPQQVRARRRRR